MSLESSAAVWDALTFWLTVAGAVFVFVAGITGVVARRYNRALDAAKTAANEAQRAEIAKLGRETAEANARAAEANRLAEQERLARLRIEATLAPRDLSPDQLKALSAKLRPFGPQQVDIFLFSNDGEVVLLERKIAGALTAANWTSTAWGAQPGPGTVVGLVVEASSDADQKTQAAAKALAMGLVEQHLSAAFEPTRFDRTQIPAALIGPAVSSNATIRLFMGKKS
jgi:hypothetical protein